MSRKPKSRLLGELHEIMSGLHAHGMVDTLTMRQFDEGCFLPEVADYDAGQIRELRERFQMSQAYFAATINASPVTVQKWEHGTKKPGGMAMKLLSVLDRKGVEVLL